MENHSLRYNSVLFIFFRFQGFFLFLFLFLINAMCYNQFSILHCQSWTRVQIFSMTFATLAKWSVPGPCGNLLRLVFPAEPCSISPENLLSRRHFFFSIKKASWVFKYLCYLIFWCFMHSYWIYLASFQGFDFLYTAYDPNDSHVRWAPAPASTWFPLTLILLATLGESCYDYSHFTGEETGAERGNGARVQPHLASCNGCVLPMLPLVQL